MDSLVTWVFYILIGFLCLIGVPLALELAYKLWRQVVRREWQVDSDQGAIGFCEVANEVLDRQGKPPVDMGTWLKRADYEAVVGELKRRSAEFGALQQVAGRLAGDDRTRLIQLQVEGCLAELAGDGGKRSRLTLEEGSFRIDSERRLENNGFEVAFSGKGWLESERLAPADDAPIPVQGTIELDWSLRTGHGPDGKAALSPYRTLFRPAAWTDGARRALGERLRRTMKEEG